MFLNKLNKQEGIAFVNLLSQFAMADEVIRKEEKYLLDKSYAEMEIDRSEIIKMSYEDARDIIKGANPQSTNIVYFELMRMALVDGEYEIEEVEFLEKLAEEFKISRSKKFQLANYFYNHYDLEDNSEKAIEAAKKIIIE